MVVVVLAATDVNRQNALQMFQFNMFRHCGKILLQHSVKSVKRSFWIQSSTHSSSCIVFNYYFNCVPNSLHQILFMYFTYFFSDFDELVKFKLVNFFKNCSHLVGAFVCFYSTNFSNCRSTFVLHNHKKSHEIELSFMHFHC